MKNFKLEHGFTLLELLASIVILVIVLTSFFSFFTQSAMFSKKNEDSLVAVNLAREVLEEVKKNSSAFPPAIFDGSNCLSQEKIDKAKGPLSLNDDGTFAGVAGDLYPCLIFSQSLTTTGDTIDKLFLVTIEIRQLEGNHLLTKTYGYVREKP